MKKIKIKITIVFLFFLLLACQKEYKGDFVEFSDSTDTTILEKLEEYNIPYKVKENKVYIPEDAVRTAIIKIS